MVASLDGDLRVEWDSNDTPAEVSKARRRGRDVEVVVAGDVFAPSFEETASPSSTQARRSVGVALVDDQFTGSTSASSTQPETDGLGLLHWERDVDPDTSHPLVVFTNTSLAEASRYRARRKVAWLLESPDVHTHMTDVVLSNPRLFDLVVTNDRDLARRLPRAVHVPAAGCWIPPGRQLVHRKTGWCSMIASRKADTAGHKFRLEVAEAVQRAGWGVDLYGRGHGGVRGFGELADKSDGLVGYHYSITMENCRAPGYFSEKLIDCFRTGTIPVYWGALEVPEFFDPDGILAFDSIEELPGLLQRATPQHWERVRGSVEENFRTAARYRAVEDRMFEVLSPLLQQL